MNKILLLVIFCFMTWHVPKNKVLVCHPYPNSYEIMWLAVSNPLNQLQFLVFIGI
jgi:hypothetical protein